jgi:4-diphosphocytidyl-2-C-methyl-D-erythritol kinase
LEETAFAKINLALHVRGREPDGYHRLETIFAFAEDGDRLSVVAADELSLEITGPFAQALSGDNLVMQAAEALRDACSLSDGAALLLDKRLPVASGIGGGSADAAATLRLLRRFWKLDAADSLLLDIAGRLGADVPACFISRTMRGEGRGDRLKPADGERLRDMPLLLVNPRVPVSTAAVFSGWDGVDRGPLNDGVLEAALHGRNDLERPARAIAPEINDVLVLLAQLPGNLLSRMSGSGATCFALFETGDARDAARQEIGRLRPAWWQLPSRIR